MDSVFGRVTRNNSLFSWEVSIREIFQNSQVYSPPFFYEESLWRIAVTVCGKQWTYACLRREPLEDGLMTIFREEPSTVSFALGYKREHGESVEDPPILNNSFYGNGSAGQCYFMRECHWVNMYGQSMFTITCRFLERRVFPSPAIVHNPYDNRANTRQILQREAKAIVSGRPISNTNESGNLEKFNKEPETDKALSSDFRELLSSGYKSDVVLKVQDKEFPAHKAVLGARSPVFRATFSHDSEEDKTGVVTIPDCDPESFSLFLSFLYSGRVGELTADAAQQLYATSDKYDVQRLKSICCDHLKRNLTAENVCDVAVLADLHSDDGLASAAQLYFNENYISVVQTSEWTATLKDNYSVSDKLLREMASAAGKKRKRSPVPWQCPSPVYSMQLAS